MSPQSRKKHKNFKSFGLFIVLSLSVRNRKNYRKQIKKTINNFILLTKPIISFFLFMFDNKLCCVRADILSCTSITSSRVCLL